MDIIDQLPANSRFAEAVAEDDEAAEFHLADVGMDRAPARVRISEWSPEVAELRNITDRLATVIGAVIGAAGGKPPNMPALPRPEVAADRLRVRMARERHRKMVARMIPTEKEV